MNSLVANLTGMTVLSDFIIAADLLYLSKSGVEASSIGIVETTSPELRAVLQKQFNQSVTLHERITNYMIAKEFLNPYDIADQIRMDLDKADIALSIP